MGPRSRAGELVRALQQVSTEDQSQALLVLTAAPRSEADEKLRLLAVIGQERFSEVGGKIAGT